MKKSITKIDKSTMDSAIEEINKAVLHFLEPLSLKETYAIIVREALQLVDGDEGLVLVEEEGLLHVVYASTPQAINFRLRKDGFSYQAFNTRKSFVAHAEEFGKVHPHLAERGIKSSIFIPLAYKRKSIGVLIVRSYKDKKFPDEQLRILNLFGTLASLAVRKTQLHDETKKAVDVRDLFISMAAHELRTPLTTISGYTQLLKSKVEATDFPYKKWISEISWELERLTLLVNELLEVNKVKTGQLTYNWKECNMKQVVHRAITTFRFSFPHKLLVFTDKSDSQPCQVIGDFDKLMQVIINVLENAAKFSSIESPIAFMLYTKPRSVFLKITDKGKGIPKDELSQVMEGLYKGKNTRQEGSGMGVGLYLVKNIVKQHHGILKVKSIENKGTTTEIKLPRIKI